MGIVLLACVALALPGLLLARHGPAPARLLALVALVALGVAALDPLGSEEHVQPRRIELVATDGAAPPSPVLGAVADALDEPSGDSVHWQDGGDFLERLAAAALRAGPAPGELVVTWNGALQHDPRALPEPIDGREVTALSDVETLPLAPEDLRVTAASRLFAGRPAALECGLRGLPVPAEATLVILGADGTEVFADTFPVTDGEVYRADWRPAEAGAFEVVCSVRFGSVELTRRGGFTVGETPRVLVVGGGASALAPALSVQELAVETLPALPDALDDYAAVVALDPLAPEDQERLALALDDGLGLFLVGAALPSVDQPLHGWLPVALLPPPDGPPQPEGGQGREPDPDPPPRADPPPPADPPVDPPKPPDDPEPPGGETGDAQPADGPPVEVDKRAVAMVLVIDRSGSMGGAVQGSRTKMDYAKSSAYQTARALGEGDAIAVVTFGDEDRGRVELPLTSATERKQIRDKLESLSHAREYTYLASGLRAANEVLGESKAAVRHVVVISDGEFDKSQELLLPALSRELKAKGITVSIIQIVSQSYRAVMLARSVQRITDAGGGKYYQTQDARRIPRLVSLEVTRSLERVGRSPGGAPGNGEGTDPVAREDPPEDPPEPALEEPPPPTEPEQPATDAEPTEQSLRVRAVAESALLEPRPEEWPSVAGVTASAGRPDAQVLLVAGREGLPLLALANRGLGRVGVWTADFIGPLGVQWRTDPSFPGRLAQWVQTLVPPASGPAPADLLVEGALTPEVPTPAEVAALARWSGRGVLGSQDYRLPPPRRELQWEGRAEEWALAAAAALLLLALGEYLLVRLRPAV